MSNVYRAVVFDFDLTLADSSQGFIACHRFAASKFGLQEPAASAIAASIGTPLDIVFTRFYGEKHADIGEGYIRAYQEHADKVMTDLTVMLPGAVDAVLRLHSSGLKLGIVSQKLRHRVEEVLRRESLLDCFGVVLGGDDIPAFKPDPRGLVLAIETLRAGGDSLYVGDTTIDAQTARGANLPFVAVLTGATKADEFESYEPIAILESVAWLPDLLGL